MMFVSMPRLFCLLLAILPVASVQATPTVAPEHAARYFYTLGNDVPEGVDREQVTIVDYISPMDRMEMKDVTPDSATDSLHEDRPDFLYAPHYPNHRVVNFYLHWCHACRQFQPKYWMIAKRVQELVPDHKVKFYSVSCAPNRVICTEQNARVFPSVLMLRPDQIGVDGLILTREKVNTMSVLESLGLKDEVSTSNNMRKTVSFQEDTFLQANNTKNVAFVPKKKRRQSNDDISVASAFLLPLSAFLVFISGSLLGSAKKRRLVVKAA